MYCNIFLFMYIFDSRYVPPLSPHHSPQVGTRRGRRVRTQQEDGQSWPMPRHLKLDFSNTSKYSQIQACTTNTNTNTIDSINMWRADKWHLSNAKLSEIELLKCKQKQPNTSKYSQIQAITAKYNQIQSNTVKYSQIQACTNNTNTEMYKINFGQDFETVLWSRLWSWIL